jgi:hypothetical protein
MQTKHTHFEQVPVEVVEKILEQQGAIAKRNDGRKSVPRKSKKTGCEPRELPGKVGVLS